jgi:glycerophosphoryl diester phosphodiesterase
MTETPRRPGSGLTSTSTARIAHRGASGHAPEHTVAAFDKAVELGAEYLEFDVQLTSDGVPVVIHDLTSQRTLRGLPDHDMISNLTHTQLSGADAGSWFNEAHPERAHPSFVGQPVLTLAAVLERYRHLAKFAIELKSRDDVNNGIEWRVLRTLADHGLLGNGERVVIMSLSPVSPQRLHSLAPAMELVQLFYEHEGPAEIGGRLQQVRRYAAGIGPHYTQVTSELVEAAHEERLYVWTWAVNYSSEMRRLLDAGVDGIITDYPERLSRVLGTRRNEASGN